MKLTVGDIRFSVSGYVSATIEVETGKLYRSLFPVCRMDVSVPLMEGEPLTLEQCKGELLAKARERIAEMYKEIVCGGEHPRSNHDLEERVALLEERLSGVSEKNVEFYNPDGTLAVRIGGAPDGKAPR
ncbi:hypothetical protein DPO11_20290 [Salmonella enterica]|nr:hypothetical protein [Salmonella enterica]